MEDSNYLIEVQMSDKKKRIARVIRRMDEISFVVKYLMPTEKVHEGKCYIYNYNENQEVVEFDSVCQWFDTNDEEEVGFKNISDGNFITWDDWEDLDDDYYPSSQEIESEEESLIDSDELLSDSDSDDEKKKK